MVPPTCVIHHQRDWSLLEKLPGSSGRRLQEEARMVPSFQTASEMYWAYWRLKVSCVRFHSVVNSQ
ncbi:MAG: hypothetical protein BWX86_01772 [Verrucomicrobia bacterium ADurb.Bin122]|nr:MAG: hypothetical protein BWX86_01772 [Verrucomicrobia bacterium ADurb.Bin122]